MLYELRIYHMHPGRMQAIRDRFAHFTLQIFARHGMRVNDFWEDMDAENNRLYYVMQYADMEERDRQWEAFRNDPEWQKVKQESEKDAPIVERIESIYMKRAPFFPQ
ncbi:NIPSNAP family protein [Paenibacillus doosanensis]|uniref:NIPSNAP family protein n=1 Tax=Paenibacillus doosanensis TaxID=1229154 RepID=UPI00218008EE|nr:NIPSNAP family protein [Paenibacillus doosanensis]MCS7464222.1 NIPSNAP family protein [Paenibacillus doosanensis]